MDRGQLIGKPMLFMLALTCSMSISEGQRSYACPPGSVGWPCLKDESGNPRTLRVAFIDRKYFTSNPAAIARVNAMGQIYRYGYTCDSIETAVAECFVFENWKGGWIGKFMNQVLRDLGVNVVAMTKANFSSTAMAADADDYIRCVWDVRLGNADLCVGDFWSTTSGRNLTSFTTAFDSDVLSLYTTLLPSGSSVSFQPAQLLSIFAPFERSVWLVAAITIFLCSVALHIVEAPRAGRSSADALAVSSGQGLWWRWERRRASLLVDPGPFVNDLYKTIMSLYGGSSFMLSSTRTWSGHLITLGVGIFVFIHVNSYTGSLAAYYVSNIPRHLGRVESIQDLKGISASLCLPQSIADVALPIFQSILPMEQIIVMDREGPMLEALYQGRCAAAVIGKYESLFYIRASTANFSACTDPDDPKQHTRCANRTRPPSIFALDPTTCAGAGGPDACRYARRYCDLLRVDDDTVSAVVITWALPVVPALEPWVSWAMMRIHSEGNLSAYQASEMREHNPIVCPGPSQPSSSIPVEALASTFTFCSCGIAAAIVIHAASHVEAALRRGQGQPVAGKEELGVPSRFQRRSVGSAFGHGQMRNTAAARRAQTLDELGRLLDQVKLL